jgi:hypothetical protein
VPTNLISDLPPIDDGELRWVLEHTIGRAQIASARKLVYSDTSGQVIGLVYRDGQLLRMEPGPAFKASVLVRLRKAIDEQVIASGSAIGRAILLCSRPVLGYYRDAALTTQIQRAPARAPRPTEMGGDHPFVLEFRIRTSREAGLTNLRLRRGSEERGLLLNAVLRRSIRSSDAVRQAHEWVTPMSGPRMWGPSLWARRGYQLPRFEPLRPKFTRLGPRIHVAHDADYYAADGWKRDPRTIEDALVLPESLSNLIAAFDRLGAEDRRRFLRAAFWFSASRGAWEFNASAWFTSIVSAIETLAPKAAEQCPCCKSIVGISKSFRDFVEEFAPNSGAKSRMLVYDIRSKLSHGSRLLQLDEAPWDFTVQSTWLEEQDARMELSAMAHDVLVNWLKIRVPSPAPTPALARHAVPTNSRRSRRAVIV